MEAAIVFYFLHASILLLLNTWILMHISTDWRRCFHGQKKTPKSDMSPFLVIRGSIVDPQQEMVVVGENELLFNASGILEAVEMMLIMFATWHA